MCNSNSNLTKEIAYQQQEHSSHCSQTEECPYKAEQLLVKAVSALAGLPVFLLIILILPIILLSACFAYRQDKKPIKPDKVPIWLSKESLLH